MNPINEVVTLQEAAILCEIVEGTIRHAIKTGKLKLGVDYRKAGRITLINKRSLEIFKK